eukprot:TRINITY_DN3920_c0_g1_i1.p1 TRINITY_DN3920_c0_g1~~TRINITY_DN3920_c0_g1_i1.p1  ORF type:complete len:736 (+),score=179.16 TRINITY_DN3920_c0_g1_i1:123-2330(+)
MSRSAEVNVCSRESRMWRVGTFRPIRSSPSSLHTERTTVLHHVRTNDSSSIRNLAQDGLKQAMEDDSSAKNTDHAGSSPSRTVDTAANSQGTLDPISSNSLATHILQSWLEFADETGTRTRALEEAIKAEGRGDFKTAKQIFEESLQLEKNGIHTPMIQLSLARIALAQDKIKDAREWVDKCLASNPALPSAMWLKGKFLIIIDGRISEGLQLLNQAANSNSVFKKQLVPELVAAISWMNSNPVANANKDAAIRLCNYVLAKQPNLKGGHILMAQLLRRSGRNDQALDVINTANKMFPETWQLYEEWGRCLLSTSPTLAIAKWEEIGKFDIPPQDKIRGWLICADYAQNKLRDFPMAVKYLQKSLIVCTDNVDALQRLAVLDSQLGNYQTALRGFSRLQKVSSTPVNQFNLGMCHLQLNNVEEGFKYLNLAVIKSPNQLLGMLTSSISQNVSRYKNEPKLLYEIFARANLLVEKLQFKEILTKIQLEEFYTKYVTILAQVGKYPEALQYLDTKIARPLSLVVSLLRGQVLAGLQQFTKAREQLLSTYSQVDPNTPRILYAIICRELAHSYLRDGKVGQARPFIENAWKEDPESAASWIDYGRVELLVGNVADALPYFEQVAGDRPQLYLGHYYCALSLLLGGKYERATQEVAIAEQTHYKEDALLEIIKNALLILSKQDVNKGTAGLVETKHPNIQIELDKLGTILKGNGDDKQKEDLVKKLFWNNLNLFVRTEE